MSIALEKSIKQADEPLIPLNVVVSVRIMKIEQTLVCLLMLPFAIYIYTAVDKRDFTLVLSGLEHRTRRWIYVLRSTGNR